MPLISDEEALNLIYRSIAILATGIMYINRPHTSEHITATLLSAEDYLRYGMETGKTEAANCSARDDVQRNGAVSSPNIPSTEPKRSVDPSVSQEVPNSPTADVV